jgi:hypothetical protein
MPNKKSYVRLRTPTADKPEFLVVVKRDDGTVITQLVIPVELAQLRSHTEDCIKAVMRYPIKEEPGL